MKKIKLLQNKQLLVLFVTNLLFFDTFLVFLEYFQLEYVSSFIQDQYLTAS